MLNAVRALRDKRAREKARPVEPCCDSHESTCSTRCDAPQRARTGRARVGKTTTEDRIEPPELGVELASNIRRLTTVLLEKLEQDSKEKMIDQIQMRLIGAITLRALRLWEKTLRSNGEPARKTSNMFQELNEQVRAILGENMEEAKKDGE